MSPVAFESLARRFFLSQDEARGGPERSLLADGYTAIVGSHPIMDHEGHEAFAGVFYAAFPDLRHAVEDVILGEGDRVVVRFRIKGTNTENLMGMPATDRPIDIGAMAILTFEAGKVTSLFGQFDEFGMMQQLGAIPALAG